MRFSRFIVILLLNITVFGSVMDLHDFAKVPRLIEHFQEHRTKSADFSFFEFLSLHYGSKAEHHDKEEHSQHKGLPFKSSDCTSVHVVTLLTQYQATPGQIITAKVSYFNLYQSVYSNEFSQSIWQPPKAC